MVLMFGGQTKRAARTMLRKIETGRTWNDFMDTDSLSFTGHKKCPLSRGSRATLFLYFAAANIQTNK